MSLGIRAHHFGRKLASSDLEFYDLQSGSVVVQVGQFRDLHSSGP